MNPQYTNVKVEGPSFPTKGQPVFVPMTWEILWPAWSLEVGLLIVGHIPRRPSFDRDFAMVNHQIFQHQFLIHWIFQALHHTPFE